MRISFFCIPTLLIAATSDVSSFGRQPLYFEPNLGQTDPQVRFLARGAGFMAWITDHELVIRPANAAPTRLQFAVPSQMPRSAKGLEQRSGVSSYFIGEDESKWVRNVPSFAKALVEDVYPGIDIVFYEGKKAIEYDFIVKPGADPSQISVKFDPSAKPVKDKNGDIAWDGYRHSVPKVYQGSQTITHAVRFAESELRFDIGAYDPRTELVIDPVVNLEFFRAGGRQDDRGMGIAVDATQAVYITGTTKSADFPYANSPGWQLLQFSPPISTFITKLSPIPPNRMVYSVYIGSSAGYTAASKIGVDRFGAAYVGIWLSGAGYPLKRAFQTTQNGGQDLYVAKIGASPTASGYDLEYATYLGGRSDDYLRAMEVDGQGNVYMTGETKSPDFPIVNAARQTQRSETNGFVAMISGSPSTDGTLQPLGFSMTFGGSGPTMPTCIAVDPRGAVYVGGETKSRNFPLRKAHRTQWNPFSGVNFELFAIKVARAGEAQPYDLEYSTFLGDTLMGSVRAIAVDLTGAAYVAGLTSYRPLAPIRALDESGIGYLIKIGAAPVQGVHPVEISSHLQMVPTSVHLDQRGSIYITGGVRFANTSASGIFPLVDSAVIPQGAGDYAGIYKLRESGTSPLRVEYGTLVYAADLILYYGNGGALTLGSALHSSGELFVLSSPLVFDQYPDDVWIVKVGNAPASTNRAVIQSNRIGVSFTTSGAGCNAGTHETPKAFDWPTGSTCTIVFPSELPNENSSSSPAGKDVFAKWSDDGSTSASRTVLVGQTPAHYGVLYEPAGQVEVVASGWDGGWGTVRYPVGTYFRKGQTVTLSAIPSPTSAFLNWSDSVQYTTQKSTEFTQFVANGLPTRITANFVPAVTGRAKLQFTPLAPCRLLDTRTNSGSLAAKTDREIEIRGLCGIPASASAYSLNITVVPKGQLGYLTMYPAGLSRPTVSLLNSLDGRVKAIATILSAGVSGKISAYATDATELIIDINGYFSAATPDSLVFYPVKACRVIDTRTPQNAPSLVPVTTRTISVTASPCGIPASARAYSLNATVVPKSRLGFLRLHPTGTQPSVTSTLNALTGTVVANAAIVPAGTNGSVDAYATEATDLILDINGYFAPPGEPGGLHYFPMAPCRGLDTRIFGHGWTEIESGAVRTRFNFPLETSRDVCPEMPFGPLAKAWAVNVTVWPQNFDPGPTTAVPAFGYLTLYNYREYYNARPLVSTLNAIDGAITSNSAIVEASGWFTAFGSDFAYILVDATGFFAP